MDVIGWGSGQPRGARLIAARRLRGRIIVDVVADDGAALELRLTVREADDAAAELRRQADNERAATTPEAAPTTAAAAIGSPSETERALDWIRSGNTGISSKQIWKVMTGLPLYDEDPRDAGRLPSDPDDFARCHALLEKLPEWRDRMPEVARRYPQWGPMVREWYSLTAMLLAAYEHPGRKAWPLYERMQELRIEAGAMSGPVFREADANARREEMERRNSARSRRRRRA